MLFYGTLKSYASPWIEHISTLITERVSAENATISMRLDRLENTLANDLVIIDNTLEELRQRLDKIGIDRQLEGRVNMLEGTLSALETNMHRLHEKVTDNAETNELSTFEQDIISDLKTRILQSVDQASAKAEGIVQPVMAKQEELEARIRACHDPLLGIVERMGQLDVKLTTLEGALQTDKIERENSRLKRKSGFLSR